MSDHSESGPEKFQWTAAEAEKPERTVVLVPDFERASRRGKQANQDVLTTRSLASRVEEAEGLVRAINLDIRSTLAIKLKTVRPATLFGTGKVDEIHSEIEACEAGLVIVDHTLSPVQQQNLEEAWQCKILDRTGLILEIFGERARTKEGRLQVDLAHLEYQRGRLVRQWTHLERQRGGGGFMGGPGETQIEADRREIQSKILGLKRELDKVRKTRELHRAQRRKVPYPIVALVGYTNAGKSTLFNALTGASVVAQDQLFATLDPTMRNLELPSGEKVILSDTVGFVSNLPTHLVAAFRATLEEVIEADVILHVRDIADPDTEDQKQDVETILRDLGVEPDGEERLVEIWNKIDLLDDEHLNGLLERFGNEADAGGEATRVTAPVTVSAIRGLGLDRLKELIDQLVSADQVTRQLDLAPAELSKLGWIYENLNVLNRTDNEDGSVTLEVRGAAEILKRV